MGTVKIRAGVLLRQSEYFGNNNKLSAEIFDSENIQNPIYGWLDPSYDGGLGQPSSVMSIQEVVGSSRSLLGVAFYYNYSTSIRKRIFISATSAAFAAALESVNPNHYVELTPISPYTV